MQREITLCIRLVSIGRLISRREIKP